MITFQAILPFAPQLLADTVNNLARDFSTQPGQVKSPPAAPDVTVNRTVPEVQPPSTELKFSATPSDEEIYSARVFSGPIISVGATAPDENADLAQALLKYRNRTDNDDAAPIETFLKLHPGSPRYLSLSADLAAHYRRTSQFSQALAKWEQIWAMGKDVTDVDGQQVVDQAVGEWASFLVTLGRLQELKALFQYLQGRDLHGAAAVKLSDARFAVWQMEHQPTKSFKCGPYSLSRIQHALDPSAPTHVAIMDQKSSTNGTSLYENWLLAKKIGLRYQMAKRQAGADIPLPAMVHWKLGHFSALIKRDGNYLIEDPTFNQGWVSSKALDAESDGYFLIPDGPLPAGWSTVTADEGKTIFGQSTPTSTDSNSPTPGRKPCRGMAVYDVGQMAISLTFFDEPISYTPPRGPQVTFGVTYAERTIYESGPFSHSNLGNQWCYSWLQYIADDTTQTNANVNLVLNNGNALVFTGFNPTNKTYLVEPTSQAQLTKLNSTNYQCLFADGSLEIYSAPENTNGPRRVYMTKKQDPAGNALTFRYDSKYRLTNVVDAIGQVTTLTYGSTDIYKITKVTDPFGRFATFQYNGSGQLTNITDTIGVTSSFTYGATGEADFINALTTPYGTTTFTNNNLAFNGRLIQVTDPLGAQERYELTQGAPGIIDGDPVNLIPTGLNLNYLINYYGGPEQSQRMTFFWDKRAMAAMQPGQIDYTKARQYLWTRTAANHFVLGSTLEAIKQPLESARLWFNYPGQTRSDQEGTNNQPNIIARVLDDGTTQATQYQFNSIGKPVLMVDPANRTNLFTYATNNIDLLTVAQLAAGATNVLAQLTYTTNHLPLTAVDAAGNTTYFGYNTNSQLTAMTNALNEIVLLKYSTTGYLTNIVSGTTTSLLSTNAFTYDGYGRVRTVKDSQGNSITTSYDAADRATNITYLDGTYEQIVYNALDPVLQRDRNGYWTSMVYDPLRHLTDTYDNGGHHTQFGWCGCGSLENIVDPMGRVTAWVRDLQGRVTTKINPDLTQITSAYETNSSRLKSVTDAKSQTTRYSYFIDNNLKQVVYSNAITPDVSFTYDTNYNRLVTMTDGIGTTAYSYYAVTNGQMGSGLLASVDGPFANDTITYSYDTLGRITSRAINGVGQSANYDSLGRVTVWTNALGSFTNVYLGATGLIATNFAPFGKQTVFSYLSVSNNQRLAEIWNQKTNGVTLSKFDYSYDALGNITNWTQQTDNTATNVWLAQYDPVNQLLAVTVKANTAAGAILNQYAYGYDLAGNRTSEQIGRGTGASPIAISQSSYNSANQLTSRTGGSGQMQFAGSLDEPGTVTVNTNAAVMNNLTTNFLGYAQVTNGTNVIPVTARDYSNNSRTNKYQVIVTNTVGSLMLQYDLNGNMTNDGAGITYEYDAANRTVAINRGTTNRTEFAYDGAGRRVQVIEKTNGVAYTTNTYIWCGTELCEQRDMTGGTITKSFFGEGELINGTKYYFTRDHLGSIREMVDSAGVIQARYDYDPYGRRMKASGIMDADFGFTGHFSLASQPETTLTLYRLYRADLGRWLSKDPMAEAAGLNLYAYVGNNPINATDDLGLITSQIALAGASAADIAFLMGTSVATGMGVRAVANIATQLGENWDSPCRGQIDLGRLNRAMLDPQAMLIDALAGPIIGRLLQIWGGYAAASAFAAETAPSIKAQLQTHLDNAVARFGQEGFTPNQAAALVENPNLRAAYRGSQIDTFFKESVSADANLQNLQITPRFKFGPDVFDPANNVWYDVTTPAQWQNHVLKYTPGFGQGVPLFH